eukprot:25525-Hanusia_phi.AAC.1
MREHAVGIARVVAGGAGRVSTTPRRAQEERRGQESRGHGGGGVGIQRRQVWSEVRGGDTSGMDFDLQRAIQESMEEQAPVFEAGGGGRERSRASRESVRRSHPIPAPTPAHAPALAAAAAAAAAAATAPTLVSAPAPPAPAPVPPAQAEDPPDGRVNAVLSQLTRPATSNAPRRASSPEAFAAFHPRPPPRRQDSRRARPLPGVRSSHPEPLQRQGAARELERQQSSPGGAEGQPASGGEGETGFTGGGRGYVLGRASSAAERMDERSGGGGGGGGGGGERGERSGTPPLSRRGLSEREKRAIAAERRLAMMNGADVR